MKLKKQTGSYSSASCCIHSQGCLHRSPSTLGKAPLCPPACFPSFPEPRSASLSLYGEPGWPAHSTLRLAVKGKGGRGKKEINTFSNLFVTSLNLTFPWHKTINGLDMCLLKWNKTISLSCAGRHTNLPVGIQVGSRYLQSDQVLCLLVQLLCEEAGLLRQQVSPDDLLL